MKPFYWICVLCCFLPLWVLHGSEVPGSEADPPEDATLPAVVVTASGAAEDSLHIPVTINTITPARAAANNAYWTGETMNQMPGVYFAQLRNVTDAPSIRLPLTYSNYYLYLQDGVPLQATLTYNHSAFTYSAALTSNGGMELLKGPGTALYGSDAVAAVINTKSLEPTTAWSGHVRAGIGMFGAREFRSELSTGITATQTARVAFAYDGDDGWRETSKWERYQGLFRHRYETDKTKIDTIVIATSAVSQMAALLDHRTMTHNPKSDGLQPGVPKKDALDTTTYFRVSSAVRQTLTPSLTLEVTPYARTINQSYMEIWNPSTTPVDKVHTATLGGINRLRWQPAPSAEVILGTDVEATRLSELDTQKRATVFGIFGFLTSYQGKHYDYDVDYLSLSPYVQYTQTIADRLVVSAGVRYDSTEYNYREHLGPTTDPNDFVFRPPSRIDHFDQVSPKFGVTWLMSPTQSLFARYAHGFRIPSSYSLYSLTNGQAAFKLKPETMDSFELGWKGRVPQYADWELDAYWMESRDGIVDGVVTAAGTISANGGRRRFRGIELGGNLYPGAGTEIGLSYARTFHEIIRELASGSSPNDGKIPSGAPDNLANLRLGWRSTAVPEIHFELEVEWLGRWYSDNLNTKRTPDVVLFNVRQSLPLDEVWTLNLKVLNLFNHRYAATAESFSYGDFYRPGAPFMATVNVEASL